MRSYFLISLTALGCQFALASSDLPLAAPVNPAFSGTSSSGVENGSATSSPGAATSPGATPRLNARRPLTVKARVDDGRSMGFHQSGGDQPAGDQQFRPPDRIQAENERLRSERPKNRDKVEAPK